MVAYRSRHPNGGSFDRAKASCSAGGRAQPPSHGLHDADAMAFNGDLSPSLHPLMGYSFELLLKAAYVACGGKEKELRAIGHDLLSCLNRAEKAGSQSKIPELRWIIEQLRTPHLGHQFRYGQNDVVQFAALSNRNAGSR